MEKQVLKLNDGNMKYVCTFCDKVPHYRLYWLHNSWDDNGFLKSHKTLIQRANTMKPIIEYIAEDYAVMDRKFNHAV